MKTKNVKKIMVGGLILLNSSLVIAQNGTENAVFMPGPSTEEAPFAPGGIGDIPTTVYDTPLENYTPTDRPSWDVPVSEAPPITAVEDLPPEFWANLKAAHTKQMILKLAKLNIKATEQDIRYVNARSGLAFDDLTFYSITIEAHARALWEGKDPMFYVDKLNARDKDAPRIIRDAQRCKDRFEIYSGDDKSPCSLFPTHEIAERHYKASKDTVDEKNDTIAWLNSINQDLAKQLDLAVTENSKLKAQIKKLKRGKK